MSLARSVTLGPIFSVFLCLCGNIFLFFRTKAAHRFEDAGSARLSSDGLKGTTEARKGRPREPTVQYVGEVDPA